MKGPDLQGLVVIQECAAAPDCLNSVRRAGGARAKCRLCLYAGNGKLNFWKPDGGKRPHPEDARRKAEARKEKQKAAAERRRSRDTDRIRRLGRAARAEKQAAAAAGWKSSLNSGRVFQDGDMKTRLGDLKIVLDHKQQSGHGWTVRGGELDKVRADAERLHAVGALVLASRTGRRVVVFDLDDWNRLERHANLDRL